METNARKTFNAEFSEEKYQSLLQTIEAEFPGQLDFRVAESPVFIDRLFKSKLLMAANQIVDTLLHPDLKSWTENAIPDRLRIPGESPHPHFLAIDFAVCRNPSTLELEPQLIELQGFPSLFGYQWYLSQLYRDVFSISDHLTPYFQTLNDQTYVQRIEQKLWGDTPKEQIVLLEIEPERQKTRLDFAITEHLWGIRPVCLTQIYPKGNQLFYLRDGREVQIKKIYNRVIFDEIDRLYPDLQLPISLQHPYEVEWITHPHWFFRISKYLLPRLKGPYFPATQFLSDVQELPQDLENYVLKPLFSFAGSGVIIDVTSDAIQQIQDPANYILQRKVTYEPVVEDVRGEKIKAEIRLLFIWGEGDVRPTLMTNLARLSRGKMIGVDFNENFDWVGGSAAFFEKD